MENRNRAKTITQAEIAKELGIMSSVVSNALRGLRPVGKDGKCKLYEAAPAWAAVQKYFEGRIDDVRYRTNVMLEEYERCADIAEIRKVIPNED